MNKDYILAHLDFKSFYQSYVINLKENGKGEAIGLCPFHNDKHPSLSVNIESGLYNCFACGARGDVFTFYQKLKGVDFPTALKEIAEIQGITDTMTKLKVVASFEYKDAEGKTLYIKERLEPGRNGRDKEFIFRHRKNGQLVTGRGCEPLLYNLLEIIKSNQVFFTEGEKKADLLRQFSFVGTSLDSGANSPWREAYDKVFEGKEEVVILPDNDTPGKSYALRIAQALYGKVGEIKVVELPGLKEAEDIINWARIEGNDKEKLIELIRQAPEWTEPEDTIKPSFSLIRLGDLLKEPEEVVSWQVEGILPVGGFSILASKPKVGKSTLSRNLALHTAQGKSFIGREVNKGPVIYYALEEKKHEVRRHFEDMGAVGEEDIYIYAGSVPMDALTHLREVTQSIKPALIIIDPLFRLTRIKDGNDYAQVTQALEPLLRLARETGTHVLCTHHTTKGDRQGGDSVLGSTAIFSSVDTLILMRRLENYRTIQTIQRYGEDLEETTLHFDKDTRTLSIGKSKQEEDIDTVKKVIIEFLSSQEEPVTEAVITEEIEGRTTLKRKALRDLVGEGTVVRDGKGGKGDPFKYSCSLVPTYIREQQNKNPENAITSCDSDGYSCSHNFAEIEQSGKTREQAFLGEKQEVIDLTGIDFEVIE